jgi:hypothetical protein
MKPGRPCFERAGQFLVNCSNVIEIQTFKSGNNVCDMNKFFFFFKLNKERAIGKKLSHF